MKSLKSLADRLADRSVPEPNSGCVLWLGAVDSCGYGHMSWLARVSRVHRLAWMARYGAIPDGMGVLHRCDQPSCLNVSHLFLGDHRTNMRDMVAKGRCGINPKAAATHCKRGHLFDAASMRRRGGEPRRECNICKNILRREAFAALPDTDKKAANAAYRIYAKGWRMRRREQRGISHE